MSIDYRIGFFAVLIFTLNVEAGAQRWIAHVPADPQGHTLFRYLYQKKMCRKLGLREVVDDPCSRHFRLWTGNRVLDLCKNEGGITTTLIRWVQEYTPNNETPTRRVFKQFVSLDTLGIKVDTLIENSKIKEIPDQFEIEGWDQGLDGTLYMIEYTEDSVYYFKSYWTPSAQQDVNEAVAVEQFINNMLAIVETSREREQFIASIPFQCWTNGGVSVACKVLSRGQAREYRRERISYRKIVKMAEP